MPRPEEAGREREVRGTYIEGFPESERAIRGTPEALRVLRGKHRCAESSVARKTGSGEPAGVKIGQLDLTIVN